MMNQSELFKEYNDMVEKYNMPTCECHGTTFEKFVANYRLKQEEINNGGKEAGNAIRSDEALD